MPDEILTIAEAARRSGVTTYTLRYYEQQGLMLDLVERAESGHRRYSAETLAWVGFLTKLRTTGMPVRRMRQYVQLVGNGAGNERERLALLEEHRTNVLGRLSSLEENLEEIQAKIELYRANVGRRAVDTA
jgi:DNA-binding transcriptional MerR regulator